MVHDGLWDIVNDFHMGISNELCSEKYQVTREDQDRYAAESYRTGSGGHRRPANSRMRSCRYRSPSAKATRSCSAQDECPRETTYEALAKMKPAFKKDGVTTAGNASIISDGAAAVVVMAREKAEALGCTDPGHHRRSGLGRNRHEIRAGGPDLGDSQSA